MGGTSVLLQGFPDYSPPQFVVDALVEAAKTPLLNQYTRSQVQLSLGPRPKPTPARIAGGGLGLGPRLRTTLLC